MEAHEDLSTGLGRLGRENSPLRAKCDIGTPDVTSLDLISNLNKSNEVETKSPHPDYVQTLKVKDANGQIKELIFPKGLDLDRPKRARTTFTGDQLATLEKEFRRNQYLVGRERSLLASRLGLSETQVKVWYQNRRTKHKRDREREVETSSLPCVTPSFSSSTSTSSSYFPFQPSSLPPSVVAFPDSSSSSSTPSSTTKNQVTSKEGNIDVSWTTIGPSPLVNAHLHSNGSIESSSKCLKSSLPSDEGKEKNLGSSPDDGTPKYPYRNHPYYPHCATSSSLDKLETLENSGTKPFESPIPPLENLMYSSPEHPHPLSALFGTFHSVSPTLPHSAFRPLASRPTHQNPFYYLKPAGYPSWLP